MRSIANVSYRQPKQNQCQIKNNISSSLNENSRVWQLIAVNSSQGLINRLNFQIYTRFSYKLTNLAKQINSKLLE
ncbi:MAG: hypothetical protein EAZ25_07105 [Oscillatoriales cyanobacterium]|nr:MAG: hypothetical protein EAZ25_07105 [Oscillatoriales cyanobacterium]